MGIISVSINQNNEKIIKLLELFNSGLNNDAEKLALSLSIDFSDNQIIWKILGILYAQKGNITEALKANKKAVELVPNDEVVLCNLASNLFETGEKEEAVLIYKKAINLKKNFAEAHSNLGKTFYDLGKLHEAEEQCRLAIDIKFNFPEAHFNLGNVLQSLYRYEDSIISFKQAIKLEPNYTEALYQLANTHQELGSLEEAEKIFKKAILLKPDFALALFTLSKLLIYKNNTKGIYQLLERAMIVDPNSIGLKACVLIAINKLLEGDIIESKKYLDQAFIIKEKKSKIFQNEKIFYKYLIKLFNWHENKSFYFFNNDNSKKIFIIGESHSLVSHYLDVNFDGKDYKCKSFLIIGCKQWHLGNSSKNKYKIQFENLLSSLPKSSLIMITIGEIDCRLDSGILKVKKKYPEKNLENLISITIENFLKYICKINLSYSHNIIIQGIPCPNINIENISKEKIDNLIFLIKTFNTELKSKSKEKGLLFLDLGKLTDRGDGFSNKIWHLDNYHVTPDAMIEAFDNYIY